MNVKTYMKRAYATTDMNRSNYHESNALHHVIERLQTIVKEFETGKNEGINTKGGE